MDQNTRDRIERFCARLRAWVGTWEPPGGLYAEGEGWEAISTPWYRGSVGDNVAYHVMHTAANCAALLRALQHLGHEDFPKDDDDLFRTLFEVSPFTGGPMVEIKYMAYQFGPLYHNMMNQFLKYMNEEDFARARDGGLLWSGGGRDRAADSLPVPSLDTLASRLKAFGALGADELLAVANRLAEVWKAVGAFLQQGAGIDAHTERQVWVGLVAVQASLQEILAAIVRFEPLWAVYEHSGNFVRESGSP